MQIKCKLSMNNPILVYSAIKNPLKSCTTASERILFTHVIYYSLVSDIHLLLFLRLNTMLHILSNIMHTTNAVTTPNSAPNNTSVG